MKDTARIQHRGVFIILCLIGMGIPALLSAQVVSISATVPSPPDTVVSFSGIAYPNADVTILEDGFPFTTTTANGQARFSVSVGSLTPGSHTYTLSAEAAAGRDSKIYQVVLLIVDETTTTVSNIFFGPTIELSESSIQQGDSITLSGTTSPNSVVTIQLISGSTATYTTNANSSGLWSRNFSSELVQGSYSIRARAIDPDTSVSEWSEVLSLTVGAPPDPCIGANMADINCDGEVNLTDLSILLSYWGDINPTNVRTDINGDTRVNLIDFSIMMYYWTGPT